jgi:hypothetical protein
MPCPVPVEQNVLPKLGANQIDILMGKDSEQKKTSVNPAISEYPHL